MARPVAPRCRRARRAGSTGESPLDNRRFGRARARRPGAAETTRNTGNASEARWATRASSSRAALVLSAVEHPARRNARNVQPFAPYPGKVPRVAPERPPKRFPATLREDGENRLMKGSRNRRGLLRTICAPAWAVIALAGGGCVASGEFAHAAAPASPEIVPVGDLTQPSVRVVIRGRVYQIEPAAWVDLMPPITEGRVRAAVRVRAIDGRPLPPDLRVTRVQLIQPSGRNWVFVPRRVSVSGPVAEFASNQGPRWEPGGTVSVAVTLSTGGRSVRGIVRGVVVDGAH